jgi:hypothetical protein
MLAASALRYHPSSHSQRLAKKVNGSYGTFGSLYRELLHGTLSTSTKLD